MIPVAGAHGGAGTLPMFLFVGQSYFGWNSNNGRFLNEIVDNPTLMLDGPNGVFGAGSMCDGVCYSDLVPARDHTPIAQSPVTPFLYHYALRASQQGLSPQCVGHAEARSNGSVEHLLPAWHHLHQDCPVFSNAMIAVSSYAAQAARRGARPEVPAVFFCQGTGDNWRSKEEYRLRLDALFDALRDEIRGITGQAHGPTFFIVQPPSKPIGGRWPCLQAHVDASFEREDTHVAVAGWAIPQHDRTHFTGDGTVMVGEACAEAYLAHMRGEDLSAPVIRSARRADRILRVEASDALVADDGPATPRHRVRGKPLRHLGLQLDAGAIERVAVDGRRIEIELAPGTETPSTLYFACTPRKALGVGPVRSRINTSANRGNIRASRSVQSLFLNRPLHRWMASSATPIELA